MKIAPLAECANFFFFIGWNLICTYHAAMSISLKVLVLYEKRAFIIYTGKIDNNLQT